MAKKITLEEFKSELQRFCKEYIDGCLADYEGRDGSAKVLHWFEEVYMKKHLADMCLDHTTFRLFLRLVLSQYYTKKDVDKLLSDQKWFLLDFINESILTAVPYKDKEGNVLIDTPIDELIGRVLYDAEEEKFFQYRDDAKGEIYTYYLYGEELRDFQIVFLENMPTLEESIYYMKDGKLESILVSEEHAGLMSKEDKIKLDSIHPEEYLKQVSIEGENLPKEDGVVDIPKATNSTIGLVKAGENVMIGEDGSVNVDIPVSIDEVVNLRSITTEPATANEGDCYYNGTTTLIHYYIDGAWDAGAEPQKSKVYFFEDGADIHQYRSDGNILIEIQDTPQIATDTTVGIVKGGSNVTIDEDGTMQVDFQGITDYINNKVNDLETKINQKADQYGVATTTQLGLVMASEESNDTARQIKEDGNVQVSTKGKMRVRKIVEEKSEGYDKNRFIVNPDKTIEELRDEKWKHVTSETKTVTSELTLDALYTFYRTDWNWTNTAEETIKEGLLHIELPEGSDSVTLTISGPKEIQKIPSTKKYLFYKTTGVCSDGYTAATRYECYENVIYDIKLTNNSKYVDEDPVGLIEPSVERVSGGNLIREFTIKKPGDYYVFLKTEDSYLERQGDGTNGCYSNTTDSEPDDYPHAYDVKVKCTYLQEIRTEVRYTGQNIVLGKNGLLIECPEGEAYIRVNQDGEIEHNLGTLSSTGEANVIESVRVNEVPLEVNNKSVNIKISQNGEPIIPNEEGVIDIIASGGGTATVPDAVEDNVVTFATEGQLKDSGKKIGGEEFGEYEQIPVREVIGNGQYGSEAGKVYGYCVAKNDTYINNEIVYKEKECVTAIGKIHYSAPYSLLLFNTEGDVNSGFVSSVNYDVSAGNNIVHYLNGERIIDANTIATEKGVENFLTTFNLVAPKFKTGDVVYRTNVPNFHFGVMSWEDYVKNPTNDMSTKVPIGLVVDPVKRTFLFCELLNKYFCNSDNIETYFGGYTSFDDGAEAFERISKLKGTSKAVDIPAFYGLRNQGMAGTIFYVKNEVSYVPALEEWRMAKEHLCTAFYGDDDSYAGFMDRLIALKNSIAPSDSLFIGKHNSGVSKLFYSQLSTVGKTLFGNVTFANGAYNMNGEIPTWDNATDEYPCCPVFGIYTEEEENA